MPVPTVFLSCRAEDAFYTRMIRDSLEKTGAVIVDGLGRGPAEVHDAITGADLFVACVSPGGYATDEVQFAISKLAALEHDRWWFAVVCLGLCEIPDVPITPKVSLRDLVADPLELLQRRASSLGTTTAETEFEDVAIGDGRFTGNDIRKDQPNGNVNMKTSVKRIVVDKGEIVGNGPRNGS
jgi:hypothetical protein